MLAGLERRRPVDRARGARRPRRDRPPEVLRRPIRVDPDGQRQQPRHRHRGHDHLRRQRFEPVVRLGQQALRPVRVVRRLAPGRRRGRQGRDPRRTWHGQGERPRQTSRSAIPAQRSASTFSLAGRWVSRAKIRSAPAGSFAAARRARPARFASFSPAPARIPVRRIRPSAGSASCSSFFPGSSRASAAGRSTHARALARSPRTSSRRPGPGPLNASRASSTRGRPFSGSPAFEPAVGDPGRQRDPPSRLVDLAGAGQGTGQQVMADVGRGVGDLVEEVEQRLGRRRRRAERVERRDGFARVFLVESQGDVREQRPVGLEDLVLDHLDHPGVSTRASVGAFANGPRCSGSPGVKSFQTGAISARAFARSSALDQGAGRGFQRGGAGPSTFETTTSTGSSPGPIRRPVKRYPAFLTKTNAGASKTPGIVNRPSSSVVSLVRLGPSPDWKTSAPATALPSASTTRPATDRSRDGPAEDHVGQFDGRRLRPARLPRLHPRGGDGGAGTDRRAARRPASGTCRRGRSGSPCPCRHRRRSAHSPSGTRSSPAPRPPAAPRPEHPPAQGDGRPLDEPERHRPVLHAAGDRAGRSPAAPRPGH